MPDTEMMKVGLSLEQAKVRDVEGRVCHVDELDETAQEELEQLVSHGWTLAEIDENVAVELRRCEYVKYVDYYRVTVQTQDQGSGTRDASAD